MTYHYDQDLDQLAVRFSDRSATESEEVAPGFILDYDSEGRIVGFEIEHASRTVDLKRLDVESLPLDEVIFRRSATYAA